jgi:hypothetical protein
VGPPLPVEAIAYAPLLAAPPAQPPSAQETASSAAAIMARGAFRHEAIGASLIAPCDIVKMR